MSKNTPTLASVLSETMRAWLADLHTCMPCRVEKYDARRRCVSVKPIIPQAVVTTESEDREVASLPVICEVPVVFPGSGPFSIDWPVARGDIGIVLFSEVSLDRWLQHGRESDPGDDRRFNLSDGMFIPGLRPFNERFDDDAPAGTMVLRTASEIHAGGDQALALKSDVDELRTKLLAHTHAGVTTGGGTSGTTATAVAPMEGTSVLKGG